MTLNLTRRGLLAGTAAATALLALPALAQTAPRQGGTLTLLVDPEPPVLLTIAHTALNAVFVSGKITEGLLSYDFDLNPQPLLATEWEVSADGLTYDFTLRQGVKWHDGQPFTSADAAHSIALLKEYHPRGRATFSAVEGIETPDPHHLRLRLTRPAPFLLTALASAESPIVPKHLYAEGKANENPLNVAPIGTGPFVFKEWQRGSHVILTRNPDYWDAPKPHVDQLVIRFIPDPAARTAAIETGEIDLAVSTPVALAEVERLRALPSLSFTDQGYQYTNSVWRLEFNLEREVFKDLRVRQAFAHAIDRDKVIEVAFYGHGSQTPGVLNPGLKRFFTEDLPVHAFDPAKAEELLDAAGHPRGADGIRFHISHDFMPGEGSARTAQYFVQALGAIGVAVDLRAQDFATYIKRVYTDRDFDFNFGGMSNTFDPTVGVQRLYWSKNFKRGLPFSNGSGYSSPAVDALLEAAAVEIDPARRAAQWTEIQRHIATDLPDITLLAPTAYTVSKATLQDHTTGAEGVAGSLASAWFREDA